MNQLSILPRNEQENNREYTYRLLRYNIMYFNLKPGETLNEGTICQQLNVSRTPVREALILLKSERLVDIVPQSGSRVSLISLKNIQEGLFLRSSIEPRIYRQIAGSISPRDLDELNSILIRTKFLLDSDPENITRTYTLLQLDDLFHQIAYHADQKDILWETMKNVCSHYDRIRYRGYLTGTDNQQLVYEEHKKLYEYLLIGGDPSFDLDTFYNGHLTHFRMFFSEFYNSCPEYFSKE